MKNTIRRFLRDRRGSIAILVAFGIVALAGFAGLAVDVSSFYVLQGGLQTTADVAALAAVSKLPDETDVRARALEYVEKNMPSTEHGQVLANADVTVGNWDDGTETFTPGGNPENAVRVITRRAQANNNPAQTFFLAIFGMSTVDIVTQAIAAQLTGDVCLSTLDPSGSGALSLDSNASIVANGCSVRVNSNNPLALEANSNSSITADDICVTGDYDHAGTGTYSPAPETGCAPISDPLAALDPPPFSGCDYNNTYVDDTTTTLTPGVYCGGLHIDGSSNVTFDPGIYVVKDADFHVDSNSSITGAGVGFYLTNGATLHFDSNTQIDLSAPTSGDMMGMLLFQDRNDSGTHSIDSNTVTRLEGVIYMPNGDLNSDSNSNITGVSNYTMIFVRRLNLNSNATLVLNSDIEASNVPLPVGLAGTVSLVK